MTEETKTTPATNAVMIMMYLMYKTNIITNRQLKYMLRVIQQPFPEELAKYLASEVTKVT